MGFFKPNIEKMEAERDVKGLIKALKDKDWMVRGKAALALGEIWDARAVEPLVKALKDEHNDVVRKVVEEALYKLHWKPSDDSEREGSKKIQSEIKKHIKALGDDNEEVCGAAFDALVAMGKSSVPPLIAALENSSSRVRRNAAGALGVIGPAAKSAVPALVDRLHKDGEEVSRSAAMSLGWIGAKAAVQDLAYALEKSPHLSVCSAAAQSLGSIGGKNAIIALFDVATDPTEFGSRYTDVINALRKIGRPAVRYLVAKLRSRDEMVRMSAARMLEAFGTDAKEAVPVLREALKDKDEYVRSSAKEALEKIKS